MTLVKIDPNTTSIRQRLTLRGRYTVTRGTGVRQLKWVKLNDLSVLWPESRLRAQMMHAAKMFVTDLESRGYRLYTNEGDLKVCGPYEPRSTKAFQAQGTDAVGRALGESIEPDGEDYLIIGEFIATKGRVLDDASQALYQRAMAEKEH